MTKRIFTFSCLIIFSCICFAQTLTRLEGEDAQTLSGLSGNGRYAYGSLERTIAFFYDLAQQQMESLEGTYFVSGVSDNGIYVGDEAVAVTVGGTEMARIYPVYFRYAQCIRLPLPPAETKFVDGSARGISADGSSIVGFVSEGNDINRNPCIWTLQPDGTYSIELLPTMEVDFTKRRPQGVDAMRCSADGQMIIGRMVDWTGMFSLPLCWDKKTGQWEIRILGMDIIFIEGSNIPEIPDPKRPDPMDFFVKADSLRYQADMDAYIADPSLDNPEYNMHNYISNPDSIAKYNELATEYNRLMEIAGQKTGELYACSTGKSFDVYSMTLSANGEFFGTACSWIDPDAGGGGGDGPMPLSSNGMFDAPICFNLKTGTYSIKDFVGSGIVDGITDNGDIYFATPYQEVTRTSFVIPAGTEDIIEFTDWVKQKTGGELDMKPDFLFSYEYEDYINGGGVITVEDSLIVGDIIPSANGKVFLGTFYSPSSPEIITYFIDIDQHLATEVEDVNKDAVFVYPNPATEVLYVKGNVDVLSIVDLTGRTVYETTSVSGSVPIGMLGEGTYLVKLKAHGETIVQKIFVK